MHKSIFLKVMKTFFYLAIIATLLSSCKQTKQKVNWVQASIQKSRQAPNDSTRLYHINQVCTRIQKEEDQQPNPEYWGGILYNMAFFVDVMQRVKSPHHQVFMDVGSGNGEKLFGALCLGFKQAIGIEYNPALVKMSQQNFPALHQQHIIKTYEGDALKIEGSSFKQADFIYLYSPIKNTDKMARLLERVVVNMKDGTTLLEVNAFYMDAWKKLSHLRLPVLQGGWLAIKKEKGQYFLAQTFYESGAAWQPLFMH